MDGILPTRTILDEIVAAAQKEVARLKEERGKEKRREKRSPAQERRGFAAQLRRPDGPPRKIIAELKRASPSSGLLRDPFDPPAIARSYEAAGAAALSVITEKHFFLGSIDFLRDARRACRLPLLRKDFIIDPVQIEETVEAEADAVLLIVRILSDSLLQELYHCARAAGLEVLLEVHEEEELGRALDLRPRPEMIGINNRDLADFTVSIDRTLGLLPLIPSGITIVSESGLSHPNILDQLTSAGVHAFLIGTALMRAPDPAAALRQLLADPSPGPKKSD